MSIPQNIVDDLMVKCGRHCCICRRFEPIHLIVHHIVKESKGGTDEPDNLIPICLTCHSDVHTHTDLTRRFTVDELKGHRDSVIKMVMEGKLTIGNEKDDLDILVDKLISSLSKKEIIIEDIENIPSHAIELLITAVKNDGFVYDFSNTLTSSTTVDDVRNNAKIKDAIEHLEERGLLDYVNGLAYRVTHKGFLLADKIIAIADNEGKLSN